jgi:hypothetical protein
VLQGLSTITARSRPGVWQGGLVCTFINDCADNRATAETRSECIELMRTINDARQSGWRSSLWA